MDSGTQRKLRKTPHDLMRTIIAAVPELPEEGLKPTSEIAKEIHSKADTVADYLKSMQWVQEQPRIIKEKVGKRRYAWRKEAEKKAGRKTK